MARKEELGTKKISTLLKELAIPAIFAMLVSLLYNMVDRIYIGNMPNGTLGMAGLSIAVPVITMIQAFTMMFGTGGAPLSAIKLGENNKDGAERIMTTSFSALIISGIVLTMIIELFKEPILMMFGADAQTIVPAIEYIEIYALGTIFVQITQGMNAYINTQGFAKTGMLTVMIGAILNIVLDPIFIFVFDMGIKGAALATILSQAVSAIWVLYFLKEKSPMKLRREYMIPDLKVLGSIMMLGVSPFIMSSTESLLQISFNNQLTTYGGSMAVGTMAILMSLYQMINMPIAGIAQGAQPILSYNYGAQQYDRVRNTFKLTFKICVGYSFLAGGAMLIFAPVFARIFTSDASTIEFTSWAIRIYLVGGLLFGAQLVCQQSFMALGQAKRSLLMALLRKVILLIPMIYVLPIVFGDSSFALNLSTSVSHLCHDAAKTFCVFLAEPVADITAATVTTLTFVQFYKTKLKNQ